jgi:hypothetical protein
MDMNDQDFIDEQFKRLYGEQLKLYFHRAFVLESHLKRFMRDNNIRSSEDIFTEAIRNNTPALVEELISCIGFIPPEYLTPDGMEITTYPKESDPHV